MGPENVDCRVLTNDCYRPRAFKRQVRRLLVINKRMTTTELTRRIYRTTKPWQVGNVRRAAPKFAVGVYRRRARGMPIARKLRDC
jgi:hypothetical protein